MHGRGGAAIAVFFWRLALARLSSEMPTMKEMNKGEVKTVFSMLLCILVVARASVIKHFEREWNIALDDLTIEDRVVGKDNLFPYAKCSSMMRNERTCTVVLEAFHPDGVVYKNKCFTRFHVENGTGGVNMLQMRAVKNRKIVFSYADILDMKGISATAYLKFRVLDMLNCKSHEGKVFVNATMTQDDYSKMESDALWLTNVYPYKDGSLEAFLLFKNLCDGARCKVDFDANGKLVGEPVSYLSKDLYYNDIRLYVNTYYKTHTTKGLFIVMNGYKASSRRQRVEANGRIELKLIYVNAFGELKECLHLKEEEAIIADVDIDYHGALSICWSKQGMNDNITVVNCRHYSHDDNDIDLEVESFQFELPYFIKTLKIRRTVHSEAPIATLLVLTDECQNEACESDGHYYVRLLSLKANNNDPTLRLSSHNSHNMEISGLSCPEKNKEVSISPAWNHDGLNVCVSLTCQYSVYDKELRVTYRLVRQCFSMKYLDISFD